MKKKPCGPAGFLSSWQFSGAIGLCPNHWCVPGISLDWRVKESSLHAVCFSHTWATWKWSPSAWAKCFGEGRLRASHLLRVGLWSASLALGPDLPWARHCTPRTLPEPSTKTPSGALSAWKNMENHGKTTKQIQAQKHRSELCRTQSSLFVVWSKIPKTCCCY